MNARPPVSKRPTNVSVSAELLDKARSLGINLSQTLESGLRETIRKKERESWLRENRAAIDAYNARVERDGVWSDRLRSF
jgi:antitoxin CcdA